MSEEKKIPDEGAEETFSSHLIELRKRIIRAGTAVIVVFLSLVYWAQEVFQLLTRPLTKSLTPDGKLIVTDVTGSFFVPMKVTLMIAFVIALPIVLYQIWLFIAPGLYQHEKKLMMPLVMSSYILFLIGMAFAYFLVFPTVFHFIAHYNQPLGVEMDTDINNYLSFVITMFMAFGVTFEVPVVIVVLACMGVVSINKLKQIRPYVVVGGFVLAAVVTPPDVLSQFLLAVPLCILYELGLIAARLLVKHGQRPHGGENSDSEGGKRSYNRRQ